jgi:hypothetical protein
MSVGEVSTLVTKRATKWASVLTAFKGHTNVEAYVVRARVNRSRGKDRRTEKICVLLCSIATSRQT